MKAKNLLKIINLSVIFSFIVTMVMASTFLFSSCTTTSTENFITTAYKDSSKTTADWNTTDKMLKLPKVDNWKKAVHSPESIYSLAVYNNKLYAGGYRGIIYVYDGSSWSTSYDIPVNEIDSLAVYNNKLYAGGSYIFVYDGSRWSIYDNSPEGTILSLAVYNNKLYAGSGYFGIIYVYDGSSWSTSYDSHEHRIDSLAVYNNKLYAGSGYHGIIYVYDGSSWSTSYDISEGYIDSLAVYNNKLYAGSRDNGKIYIYNGSIWLTSHNSPLNKIDSLAVYNNKLYAGSGDDGRIYVYNGSRWSLSYNSPGNKIDSLAVYNNKLYAGGSYIFAYGGSSCYQSSAKVQSTKINKSSNIISKATLSVTQKLNKQTLDYYLSANGGKNWESVTPGVEHTFTNQGNDLRWGVVLSSTNPSVTPEVDSLAITTVQLK